MAENIVRGECAKMFVANYCFDAIRVFETGEYRVSQTQALSPIGLHKNYLSRLQLVAPNKAKTLTDKGFTWVTVSVKYHDGEQERTAKTLSVHDVSLFWRIEAINFQNTLAGEFAGLLMEDSLIDRFDQAYGKRRTQEERRADDCRILDIPATWQLMFDNAFEHRLSKVSGYHKNDIRNGKLYWEFIYYFLTPEERIKLDEVNPIDPESGRRAIKIHQCLDESTKTRLKPHIDTVYVLMGSAISLSELRRLLRRQQGFDQGDLFDGWDWNAA